MEVCRGAMAQEKRKEEIDRGLENDCDLDLKLSK
jgi:hypothetical protein